MKFEKLVNVGGRSRANVVVVVVVIVAAVAVPVARLAVPVAVRVAVIAVPVVRPVVSVPVVAVPVARVAEPVAVSVAVVAAPVVRPVVNVPVVAVPVPVVRPAVPAAVTVSVVVVPVVRAGACVPVAVGKRIVDGPVLGFVTVVADVASIAGPPVVIKPSGIAFVIVNAFVIARVNWDSRTRPTSKVGRYRLVTHEADRQLKPQGLDVPLILSVIHSLAFPPSSKPKPRPQPLPSKHSPGPPSVAVPGSDFGIEEELKVPIPDSVVFPVLPSPSP